jgi:hypothetical protein
MEHTLISPLGREHPKILFLFNHINNHLQKLTPRFANDKMKTLGSSLRSCRECHKRYEMYAHLSLDLLWCFRFSIKISDSIYVLNYYHALAEWHRQGHEQAEVGAASLPWELETSQKRWHVSKDWGQPEGSM